MTQLPTIYVAGHRGMVGSAIVRQLLAHGHPADRIITRTHTELDLTSQAAVQTFFQQEQPNQVYLAAAKVGGIHANNTYPADFIYQNLMMQANVIEAAFKNGVKKLLFLGSSCIYPKLAPQPMREDALLTGTLEPTNEPYAIAKIAGIKLCESYNRQYGTSHGVDYRSVMPKRQSRCPSYLIIRDIFPEWAVDMGLMGRGLPYRVFDAVARYQYSVADVIGVQTPGNLAYFDRWKAQLGRRLEVLSNWLGAPAAKRCSIRLDQTPLAGRKLFVYAGNMGVAQGMDTVMDWVAAMNGHVGVGFVFVGRGSDAQRLRKKAQDMGLSNVLFFDEIDPDEIPDLYAQCHVGLVALDPRHRSHNIPGKFLTYMQSGLPVLALVNKGNDLAALIREHQVGQVCESHHLPDILSLGEAVLAQTHHDPNLPARCRSLFEQAFSVEQTARQLVAALTGPQHA